jgi:hypothetical protein
MGKALGLLTGLAIFVIGTSIVIAGITIADHEASGSHAVAPAVTQPAMNMGGTQAAAASNMAAATTTAATKVQIVHLARGCHAFMLGNVETPNMTLQVGKGGALDLTNMDVDTQRMMQVAGPQIMMTGATMKMAGGHMTMTFPQAGTYKFKFTQPPMAGATDEAPDTSNPDNTLALAVQAS